MDARYAGGGGGCIFRYGVGGGCVARYVGGGAGCGLCDISMVDRMMLKFRPIAPKPVAPGSGSGDTTAENGGQNERSKRRYVRVKGTKRNKDDKRRKVSTSSFQPSEAVSGGGDAVVTLSLMPETPDRKEQSPVICTSSENFDRIKVSKPSSPIWSIFTNNHQKIAPVQRQQIVSFVIVESVTETWVDRERVGWTEEQRVRNMEMDTCPVFISDGGGRVVWRNKAYREMGGGEGVVVMKGGNRPLVSFPEAFTCNVRVTCSLTVPCDAWRMDGGGYAWRLDVKAALCLGR